MKNNLGTVYGICEGAMLSTLVDTGLIFQFIKQKSFVNSHIVLSVSPLKNACNLSENDNLIGAFKVNSNLPSKKFKIKLLKNVIINILIR